MAQESYADFSIIQKYIDQKRYHDEALKIHKSRIAELESALTAMQNELDAKDQAIAQLKGRLEEATSQLSEKEESMQDLNSQVYRLRTQREQAASEKPEPLVEESPSNKGKFGFLKR